jgi:hypothetical protein
MPKYPKEEEKLGYIIEFIQLTWEVVRRNQDYQSDYRRFVENFRLSPDLHPAEHGTRGHFESHEGRFVLEKEAADPNKCNLTYMLTRWGFAWEPNDQIPQGPSWANYRHILAKDWRKNRKESHHKPDMHFSLPLKKLPGVLDVERFPKVFLNHCEPEKAINDAIEKEGGMVNYDLLPWEVESPANLTVTINLQAPSQLIRYVLEILIETCKSELKIPDRKIEVKHKTKCLEIYDLFQEGYSTEDIADIVELSHYKEKEAMVGGTDVYLQCWGIPQVKRCIKDADEMIGKGSII